MLRGCGKQCLFEDDADRIKFLEILSSNTEKYRVSVLAWCLMDNHIHLVLSDRQDDLSPCLKAIAGHYAMYFNSRTAHVGHVFQDRFKSKPIETDGYLLQAIRYVHRNPEKAGIAAAEDYPWSSYAEYLSLLEPGVIRDSCYRHQPGFGDDGRNGCLCQVPQRGGQS